MKPIPMWVIQDRKGVVWRYTTGKPVVYGHRQDAVFDALALDKSRGWRVVRAELTVSTVQSERHGDRHE